MALPKLAWVTPQAYLASERAAETKSEYHDGVVVAMVGGSREHNLIEGNLAREIGNRLKGRPCETYPGNMRVWIPATRLYSYPDVVVVCGEPRFQDAEVDTLLNPTLIIEVLSPSTEAYDRGRKFIAYRSIPSLCEYVLVAQSEHRVERFSRQDGGLWTLRDFAALDATLDLTSIDVTLPLREIYDRVGEGVGG